jgi:hypothetical protein
MIAVRLVRLIEAHSDELADGLLNKLQTSSRTGDLRNVPPQGLRDRSLEVIRHLSEWLICKSDSDIEHRYKEMGFARSVQGVSFADFCWDGIDEGAHLGFCPATGISSRPAGDLWRNGIASNARPIL